MDYSGKDLLTKLFFLALLLLLALDAQIGFRTRLEAFGMDGCAASLALTRNQFWFS